MIGKECPDRVGHKLCHGSVSRVVRMKAVVPYTYRDKDGGEGKGTGEGKGKNKGKGKGKGKGKIME